MASIPESLGFFNPAYPYPEDGLYNQTAHFLQHLQQCLHLYCESDLLDRLITVLAGPAGAWFDKQPEFTSLHDFGIALTKAFPSRSPDSQEQQELDAKARKSSTSKNSALRILALESPCESTERPATCRHCKQTFKFKELLRKHKREQHAKKPAISSPLRSHAPKPVRKAEEKSAAKDVTALPASQELQTRAQDPQKIDVQKPPVISSSLSTLTANPTCEATEKSATASTAEASVITPAQKEAELTRQEVQKAEILKAKQRLNELRERRAQREAKQEAQKQAELAEQEAQKKAARPIPTPRDIGIFDPTLIRDIQEFGWYSQVTDFLQHLEQCQHQYRESEVLALLPKCLRGPPHAWFKGQTFISLQDFGKDLASAFPTSSIEPVLIESAPIISTPSIEYHSCSECLAAFSSISRLLQHAQNHCTGSKVICKHYEQGFNFKNKLHDHIREQHTQKSDTKSNLRFPTPESTYKTKEKSAVKSVTTLPVSQELQTPAQKHQEIDVQKHSAASSPLSINTAQPVCESEEKPAIACPPPPQESPTSSATPRNLVTDTRIPLQPVSSKGSNLPIATSKFTSECVENASIQRIACARTTCKRCKQIFNFNNKLHEHLRQNHARKPVKSSDLRALALESTYKVIEKPAASCSPAPLTPQSTPPTPPATPRSQISSAEMPSRPVSPKGSHLSIATLKITPKPVEKLPANCQLTPPPSSSRTPVRKHHESHMQKSYLTMDDLSRMFTGKSRPFGLRSHQDRPYSSQSPGIRQSSQPCSSIASKKSYLTIENLSEMFREKFKRKGMFQGQKNVSSRGFSSGQSRITAYFKPTANQKPSISQGSKSSKPKSLNQHMPTESIRTAFSKGLPEKSADLPYKLPGFSYSKGLPEKSANLPYELSDVSWTNMKPSAETPSFIFVLLRLLSAFLLALAFVSAISAARMGCINAYGQAISAIGRAIQ